MKKVYILIILLGVFFTIFGALNSAHTVYDRSKCPDGCILNDCDPYTLSDYWDDFSSDPQWVHTDGPCFCSHFNPDGTQILSCEDNEHHTEYRIGLFTTGLVLILFGLLSHHRISRLNHVPHSEIQLTPLLHIEEPNNV